MDIYDKASSMHNNLIQMQPEYSFQADLAENLGSFSMEE